MRRAGFLFFVLLLCALGRADAAAPVLDVPTGAAPALDGRIDASWKNAATATLRYDFTYRRPARDPAVARITQDARALYIAFSVVQHTPAIANQHTNGSSVLSDDYVGVYLDPQGTAGFSYAFYANAIGTRYQTSSENSAYAPEWTAAGQTTTDGYDVTMRIPLDVIRSGGSHDWKIQFVRYDQAANALDVWSYAPNAMSASDPTFIGQVNGIGVRATRASANHLAPRVQVYALGEATSRANGGSTSRLGADFSLPVTATSSLVGTIHPDYSDVESDQQTIAPSAFARYYSEVRPFFTQVASTFGYNFACSNCPTYLYTPAIPTFSQGYGYEGTAGKFSFGAFDALGDNRTDQGESLNYNYEDPRHAISIDTQRVAVDAYGLNDDTVSLNGGYEDQRTHLGFYTNNAVESGSLVTNGAAGAYHDVGLAYLGATTLVLIDDEHLGYQFSPLDGFVSQNDINGPQIYAKQTLNFSSKSAVQSVMFSTFYGRYFNHLGQVSQTDGVPQVSINFRDLLSLRLINGWESARTQDGELLPFASNGFSIGYRANTNTPSTISYYGGPYYHGHLVNWAYLSTIPVTRRVRLALETDEDKYITAYPGERSTDQWLERASIDWQPNKAWQFDLGVRRIIGPNLPDAYQPLTYGDIFDASSGCNLSSGNPYAAGCSVNASNVSAALHYLHGHNEFYLVYGNANDLITEPALFVKWIRYIGAGKGV